jgi:hypothetical protein
VLISLAQFRIIAHVLDSVDVIRRITYVVKIILHIIIYALWDYRNMPLLPTVIVTNVGSQGRIAGELLFCAGVELGL